jgi:hypothetical protein
MNKASVGNHSKMHVDVLSFVVYQVSVDLTNESIFFVCGWKYPSEKKNDGKLHYCA